MYYSKLLDNVLSYDDLMDYELMQILAVVGILAIIVSAECGYYIRLQIFQSISLFSAVFLVIFLIFSLFEVLMGYVSNNFNMAFLMLVVDLTFAILYAFSSICVIFSINSCWKLGPARIVSDIAGILNFICFAFSAWTDYRCIRMDGQFY